MVDVDSSGPTAVDVPIRAGTIPATHIPNSYNPLQKRHNVNVMSYSADEILGIAIEIENNATIYYRDAARITAADSPLHGKFLGLAGMEEEHAATFVRMRSGLSKEEKTAQIYDPGNEMLYYLHGMSGLHGWEGKAGPNAKLTGREDIRRMLTIALNAEKETVFFYTFLRGYVPSREGKETVDRIIGEEMKHVATLNHELISAGEAR